MCNTEMWFGMLLLQQEQDSVAKAKDSLKRAGKPLSAGGIVAELNFGFWTALFTKKYERIIWQKTHSAIFLHAPKKMRYRQTISTQLDEARKLRNRVSHNEPIWKYPDLLAQHAAMLETVRWISPAHHTAAQMLDRFPAVHHAGDVPDQTQIASLLPPLFP